MQRQGISMAMMRDMIMPVMALFALASPSNAQTHISASLVAESSEPAPGTETTIALLMQPSAGWHGYWINPGEAGFATRLEWQLPKGLKVSAPRYPVPERLVVPFHAVKAFYDPSAQFGLQFGRPGAANDSARQHMAAAMPDLVGESEDGASARPLPEPHAEETALVELGLMRSPAEVVQLDRFRKK